MAAEGFNLSKLDAVVARGGLLRPIQGGTYAVDEAMLQDLASGFGGDHPSNLGGLIANEISAGLHIPAFIVDPVVVDELSSIARITGLPEISRRSIFHALGQKAAARKAVRELGLDYEDANLIVVYIGGGITIGAHQQGRVVDVNNGHAGEGPLSAERAGTLPTGDLISMCFSGTFTKDDMIRKVTKEGGFAAYLGTSDLAEAERRVRDGDKQARDIYEAMTYQTAKEIGAMAAVLKGKVDAIVFTGRLDNASPFLELIENNISWIADILVFPGEDELASLAEGALRVLQGREQAKIYDTGNTEGV